MATPTALPISVDDLSAEVGIAHSENGAALPIAEQMQRAIDYAQAQIESFTKRTWAEITEERTWQVARTTNKMVIAHASSVTQVTEEELVTTQPAEALEADAYKLVGSRRLYRVDGAWLPDRLYHVTATYGYAQPPADIIYAHIKAAAYILARMTAPEGVMGSGMMSQEIPSSYEFPGEIVSILKRHSDHAAMIS